MSAATAFPLACGVQSYEWGKIGSASKAAQYGPPGFEIDEKKPYAEVRPRASQSRILYACPSSMTRIETDAWRPWLARNSSGWARTHRVRRAT
jgi:hypothetical protein